MSVPHQATETAFERLCRLIEDRTGAYPRGNGRQVSALCPAHDDRTPSLSITDGNDRVLIKCQAGCDTDDIITELGLTRADLFNEPRQKGQRPTVIAEYTYTDEHGTVLFVAERLMPKGFRQKRPDGKGGWDYKLGNTRRVIYRLPEVIEAVKNGRTIYITEGEKDVHAVEATGNVATCNPMGAGKWRDEYALTFKGADVIVIADADEPGRRHAATVAASIRSAGGRTGEDKIHPARQQARCNHRAQRQSGARGQRRSEPRKPADDGLRDDAPRTRRSAVRCRERRQALHAERRRQESGGELRRRDQAADADWHVDGLRLDHRHQHRSVGIGLALRHRASCG